MYCCNFQVQSKSMFFDITESQDAIFYFQQLLTYCNRLHTVIDNARVHITYYYIFFFITESQNAGIFVLIYFHHVLKFNLRD